MDRRTVLTLGSMAALFSAGGSLFAKLPNANAVSKAGTLKKGYLNGPFGQVHYYEQGSGPCLILAHQSPVSARMFERAMSFLAQHGLRAIAIDTPGYGNSDTPPLPPSIEDYAETFLSVIDGLGLESAHFLGHHTGASILCNFAARFPQHVQSLILNGTAVFTPEELEQFKGVKMEAHSIYEDGSHLIEAWKRRAKYTPGWSDKFAMHRRIVDQLWAGDTSWYGHNAAFSYDIVPDLMALKTRTLLLTNSGDDIYHLTKNAHALRPDFAFAELSGGTHDIVDEQPEAWAIVVADFIKKAA